LKHKLQYIESKKNFKIINKCELDKMSQCIGKSFDEFTEMRKFSHGIDHLLVVT